MSRRPPARTASSRMRLRVKFDVNDERPILGDLVREKRGDATRRAAGLEAGVGAHVVLDVENYYSAKADELEALCAWVGKHPEFVQMPPPIVHRVFGRPTKDGSSEAPILDAILNWISEGNKLSKFENVKLQVDSRRAKRLVTKYLKTDAEFRVAYEQMRALGAHHIAEECLDIADNAMLNPAQAANMIKTRQWLVARMNPRVYGNNSESNVNVNVGFGDALEQLERRRERTAIAPPQRLEVIDVEPLPLQRPDEKEGSIEALAAD